MFNAWPKTTACAASPLAKSKKTMGPGDGLLISDDTVCSDIDDASANG